MSEDSELYALIQELAGDIREQSEMIEALEQRVLQLERELGKVHDAEEGPPPCYGGEEEYARCEVCQYGEACLSAYNARYFAPLLRKAHITV